MPGSVVIPVPINSFNMLKNCHTEKLPPEVLQGGFSIGFIIRFR